MARWLALSESVLGAGHETEPAESLQTWAVQSLDALLEAVAAGSAATGCATVTALRRLQAAHSAAEVTAGLLLCRQAARPIVHAAAAGAVPGSRCGVGLLDRALLELLAELSRQTLRTSPDSDAQQVVVEERERLARELHDSVAQSLYTVTLYADAASLALGAGRPEHVKEHLRDLRQTAQDALRDMRLIIFDLRPCELEPGGLIAAVAYRLEAVEAHVGLETSLLVTGEERLSLAIEEELYRIVQEALNNVIKHARATRVDVTFEFTPASVCLEICDNGIGFDPTCPAANHGLGLYDMAARARRIGAALDIDAVPGVGTRLRLSVPRTA